VTGFVTLTNTTVRTITARLDLSDNQGSDFVYDTVTISPHETKLIELNPRLKAEFSIEPGVTPAQPITLKWESFSEAADQAGVGFRPLKISGHIQAAIFRRTESYDVRIARHDLESGLCRAVSPNKRYS
jgi:hypothetical protein